MRVRTPLLVITVAALLSACSSGPTAPEWAAQVCTALTPWRADIDELTEHANNQMTAQTAATDAHENLLTLLSGAAQASETARKGIAEAGTPDVENGQALADRFIDSLAATRDAYQSAHDEMAPLDPDDQGFYEDVAEVMEQLDQDYAEVPQVAELDSAPLRDAFAQAPECREGAV